MDVRQHQRIKSMYIVDRMQFLQSQIQFARDIVLSPTIFLCPLPILLMTGMFYIISPQLIVLKDLNLP